MARNSIPLLLAQTTPTPTGNDAFLEIPRGDIFDAVVAGCAFLALVLGIWQEYARRQASKPQIKVTLSGGFPLTAMGDLGDPHLVIKAVNDGNVPVTISAGARIRLPNGANLVQLPPFSSVSEPLPHELTVGRVIETWVDNRVIASELYRAGFHRECRLFGFYTDEADREYRSKSMMFNVAGWIKG